MDCRFRARHEEAEFLNGDAFRVELADDFPLVHHENPVGNIHDLVQLEADEQNGLSVIARGDQLMMNVFNRAYVESARWLNGDEQIGILSISRATIAFLLVAAGHAARRGNGALAAANIVLLRIRRSA